jgi:hypothetical protein
LAVVDEVGVAQGDLLFVVEGVALDADLLEGLVGFVEDGAAGRLVDAAGLHADEAVFARHGDADAVLAADLVQLRDDLVRRELLAVDGDRVAAFEIELTISAWSAPSPAGRPSSDTPPSSARRRGARSRRLVDDVPEVAVLAVDLLLADGDRDAVLLRVIDALSRSRSSNSCPSTAR